MKKVKDFYKNIPFNYTDDTSVYINSITNSNQILEYIDLHNLLRKRNLFSTSNEIKNVLEAGCGTGWLTNSIAYYYKKKIKSIDFTDKAVETAKTVSEILNLEPKYETVDIFDYEDSSTYDLVISMGVLHHTYDCKKAFKKISKFVKDKGYLYVGLYHLYGRRPMLKLLQGYAYWHGDKSSYNLFRKMNRAMEDKEHSYSWFRDQVIHPHETQHTLEEIYNWTDEIGFKIISTSINDYKPIKNFKKDELFKLEKEKEAYSYKTNVEDFKFTPGYFTVCAQKV